MTACISGFISGFLDVSGQHWSIPKLPTPHCQIVKCTLYPVDCPNEISAANKLKPFLAWPMLEFFLICPNFCLKLRLPLIFPFSQAVYAHPTLPPFLSLPASLPPSFKFLLDGSLELERSPFKIETFSSIFSTYWEQIARFWVQNSYFFLTYFNVWYVIEIILMECKSIHGNSWNLWMKWSSSNAMYGFVFYPWSVGPCLIHGLP